MKKSRISNGVKFGSKANEKSLKRYCREIWAELVKARDGNKCVLCGEIKYLNAHHLISRMFRPTTFDINCGLSVCAKHHRLGKVSAHTTPWVIYEWLEKNRPEQYKWFLEARAKIKDGSILQQMIPWPISKEEIKEEINYREVFTSLIALVKTTMKPDFFKHKWKSLDQEFLLSPEDETNIINMYREGMSSDNIALIQECTRDIINRVLRKNKIKKRVGGSRTKQEREELSKKLSISVRVASGVKISRIDIDGNIKSYETLTEAAETNEMGMSAICNCLVGRSRTSGGFKWVYTKDL